MLSINLKKKKGKGQWQTLLDECWNNDQNSKSLKQNVPWRDLIKPKEHLKNISSLLETDKILQGYRRQVRI